MLLANEPDEPLLLSDLPPRAAASAPLDRSDQLALRVMCVAQVALELVHQLLRDPASCKIFQDANEPLCWALAKAHHRCLVLDTKTYAKAQTRSGLEPLVSVPKCDSDDDVVANFTQSATQHDFVWARLKSLSGRDPSDKGIAETGAAVATMLSALQPDAADPADPAAAAAAAQTNTLVLVIGSGSHVDFKAKYREKKLGNWTDEKKAALQEAVINAREGLLFARVNPRPVSNAFGPR